MSDTSTRKDKVKKVVGILAILYALYPFIYSMMNNVTDTGDKAVDDFAESAHDGLMKFATFFTTIKAVVVYLLFMLVLKAF